MKLEIDRRVSPRHHHAVPSDYVGWTDLITEHSDTAVDRNPAFFDESVRFPSGTQTLLGKEFIDAAGFLIVRGEG